MLWLLSNGNVESKIQRVLYYFFKIKAQSILIGKLCWIERNKQVHIIIIINLSSLIWEPLCYWGLNVQKRLCWKWQQRLKRWFRLMEFLKGKYFSKKNIEKFKRIMFWKCVYHYFLWSLVRFLIVFFIVRILAKKMRVKFWCTYYGCFITLTPEVNFINILRPLFLPISLRRKITKTKCS